MTLDDVTKIFPKLFDKRGRLNSGLMNPSYKNYQALKLMLDDLLIQYGFPNNYDLKQGVAAIKDCATLQYCLICGNVSQYVKHKHEFTPFCSMKCSHSEKGNILRVEMARKSCREKYGVDNAMQVESIKRKSVNTNIARNGGMGRASAATRDKIKKTNLERRGCENPFSDPSIIKKIKQTHDSKFGCHFSQQHISDENIKNLEDTTFMKSLVDSDSAYFIHANILGITVTTLLKRLRKMGFKPNRKNISMIHLRLIDAIKELGNFDIRINDREILNGSEIDIFLPEFSLGIEVDGLYWHSEVFDNQMAKRKKQLLANSKGIKLIRVYEDELNDKFEIVLARIKSFLKLNTKIFARCCNIEQISSAEKTKFFNENHIDGDSLSSLAFALKYNEEIVQVLSIMKSRFDKNADYEIIRSASKRGVTVIGGLSKLISHAKKYGSLVTFADLRWGDGESYTLSGMKKINETMPGYDYFNSKFGVKRFSRMKFQKAKLHKILPVFDNTLSEIENMHNNGWLRIFNCGSAKFKIDGAKMPK